MSTLPTQETIASRNLHDGVYITQWGGPGSGNGQFNAPIRLAASSDGTIYVVDYGNSRIQQFTDSGSFICEWGALGSSDGQFYNPVGITVDRQGDVYVADKDNSRIQVFGFGITPAKSTSWGRLKNLYH